MSVSRPLTYLGFALWVSVCAAAPEFIWQGMLSLAGHFSRPNVYGIFLIGLILTVFVEPIMERARDGRWKSDHRTRNLLLTAPIAFIFGLVAVGLHECMTAYIASGSDGPGSHQPSVARGVSLILEWAWVPLGVTLAWFAARLDRRMRLVASAGAGVWVVSVGWYFAWPMRDVMMTSIPCIAMIPLGQRYIAGDWSENTFRNLAVRLAGFIALWLVLTLLLQAILRWAGITSFYLYSAGDLGNDFRFYLGWAIGLAIAPNPVPLEVHGRARRASS